MIQSTKVLDSTYIALQEGIIKTIIQQGGTYSGKTFSTLVAIALHLKEYKGGQNRKSAVVGQSSTEIDNGAYDDWLTIMDYLKVGRCVSKVKRKWIIGVNSIQFHSLDTVGKAKSGKWYITFFNECNHIHFDIYNHRALRSEIKILDYNPSALFWLQKKVLPTLEKYLFKRTTYLDNPTLTADKIAEIKALITDEYMYTVYVLGKTPKLFGTVFDFKKYGPIGGNNVDLRNFASHGYFLDFGFSNDVTSLGEAATEHGKLYAKQLIYKTGLLTKPLNDVMIAIGVDKRRPIYCDNIPKEIAELAVYGWILIAADKYPGSVNDTINLVKQQTVYVHEDSLDAHNEGENYQFMKTKDGDYINVPIDKHNHFCDGLRYYAQRNCTARIEAKTVRHSAVNLV